jgi:hypothetical protein
MSGPGWVAIHRQLVEHPLWTRERFTRGQAWVDLILLASYTDHLVIQGNRPVSVKRGQILTSQVKLAARWSWNRKTVIGFLRSLKAASMADIETSKDTDTGYTLVTLLNYDLFQGAAREPLAIGPGSGAAIGPDIERTSSGHRVPTINKGNKGNNIADADASAPAGKPKRNGRPRKTDPETDALLAEFAAGFQAKLGEPYPVSWGRDRKLLGELVRSNGAASVRAKLAVFFEHGTQATRERRAWTVPEFRRVFPQLIGMQAMGDV